MLFTMRQRALRYMYVIFMRRDDAANRITEFTMRGVQDSSRRDARAARNAVCATF